MPSDDPAAPSHNGALAPGQVLAANFELLSKLGEGGNGEVWKARNMQLQTKVAIKVLRSAALSADEVERFRREARALCLINSEHVLRFFQYDDGPPPFLVMELLKGEDLSKVLARRKALSLDEAKHICRQLCRGLQAAHEAGVIHRDIKPSNIYCATRDLVKLVDFGLMKLVPPPVEPPTQPSEAPQRELTEKGTLLGTPPYMSPEQWQPTQDDVGIPSDLWSLAVVLYKALTGRLPFTSKTDPERMRLILLGSAPAPSSLRPGLAPEVDAFFSKALEKDPGSRFQSAAEFGAAFASLPADPIAEAAGPDRPDHVESIDRSSQVSKSTMKVGIPAGATSQGPAPEATRPRPQAPSLSEDNLSVEHRVTSPPAPAGRRRLLGGLLVAALSATASVAFLASRPAAEVGCREDLRDCDHEPANGCEADIKRSTASCGGCGRRCVNEHGSAACVDGRCQATCLPGYSDCDGDPANGCETDLSAPEHCGSCGARCEILVKGQIGAAEVAIDAAPGGRIYWTNLLEQKVWAAPKRGGTPPQTIYEGGAPASLMARGDTVYWADRSARSILTITKGANLPRRAGKCDACEIAGLATGAEDAYFGIHRESSAVTDLWSMRTKTKLIEVQDVLSASTSFVVGATNVYWIKAADGEVYGRSLRPSSAALQLGSTRGRAVSLAVTRAGDTLFAMTKDGGAGAWLLRIADGGHAFDVVARGDFRPRQMTADARAPYWTTEDGAIMTATARGEIITIASAQGRPEGIAVDEEYVYWVNERSGEIMRAKK